jgi:hypothetical protein
MRQSNDVKFFYHAFEHDSAPLTKSAFNPFNSFIMSYGTSHGSNSAFAFWPTDSSTGRNSPVVQLPVEEEVKEETGGKRRKE